MSQLSHSLLPRSPVNAVSGAAPPGATTVISYASPTCVLAYLRNMTFCAFNGPPTTEHVDAFFTMAGEVTAHHASVSNFTLVLSDAQLPAGPARQALEQLTEEYQDALHSVAIVIDGGGLWASMIRSFLTGLHVLRGNRYRSRTFATPADANAWLLPAHNRDTGVALAEPEMMRALQLIEARIGAR